MQRQQVVIKRGGLLYCGHSWPQLGAVLWQVGVTVIVHLGALGGGELVDGDWTFLFIILVELFDAARRLSILATSLFNTLVPN